jgi:hypothetical protein
MANTFLNSDNIAEVAAKLVGADLSLAGRISRDVEANFTSGSGSTVRIRVPGSVASQSRGLYDTTTPLVSDELAEQFIPVTLSEHIYNQVPLSEGSLDLDLKDFTAQVIGPQARAIVTHVERAVAAAMTATPANASIVYAAATPAKAFTAARRVLRDAGVPAEAPLLAVVGSKIYGDLLDGPLGTFDADGKVRGIEVLESTRIDPDEIIVFVREAFSLVVRAPAVPSGAPYGASVSSGGFALRHIRSFDSTVAVERSLMSAFVGVTALPLARDLENGLVSLVPNAGAVRIVTAV